MDPNRSTVKKSLFGPVDHEAVQRHLDRELQELKQEETERMRRNFNFDANTDKPLEGRWKWEGFTQREETQRSDPVDTEMKVEDSTLVEETPTQAQQTPEKT